MDVSGDGHGGAGVRRLPWHRVWRRHGQCPGTAQGQHLRHAALPRTTPPRPASRCASCCAPPCSLAQHPRAASCICRRERRGTEGGILEREGGGRVATRRSGGGGDRRRRGTWWWCSAEEDVVVVVSGSGVGGRGGAAKEGGGGKCAARERPRGRGRGRNELGFFGLIYIGGKNSILIVICQCVQ